MYLFQGNSPPTQLFIFLWQFLITSYPSLQFEEGYHIGSGTEHVEILDFRVFGEETTAGKDMEGQRKNGSQN